jgi:hypothetical protein
MNQHALQVVRVAAHMGATHAPCVIQVREERSIRSPRCRVRRRPAR